MYRIYLKDIIDYYTDDFHEAIAMAKDEKAQMFTIENGSADKDGFEQVIYDWSESK